MQSGPITRCGVILKSGVLIMEGAGLSICPCFFGVITVGEGRDMTDLVASEPPLNAGQRTEECMKGSFKESLRQGPLGRSSNGLSGSLVTLVTLIATVHKCSQRQ